jgi:hypothetical protein
MNTVRKTQPQPEEPAAKEVALLLNPAAVKRGSRWLTSCPAKHHEPGNLHLVLHDHDGIKFHCKEGCSGTSVKVLVFKALTSIAVKRSNAKADLHILRMERKQDIKASWASIAHNLKTIYATTVEWLAWQIDELANVMAGADDRAGEETNGRNK